MARRLPCAELEVTEGFACPRTLYAAVGTVHRQGSAGLHRLTAAPGMQPAGLHLQRGRQPGVGGGAGLGARRRLERRPAGGLGGAFVSNLTLILPNIPQDGNVRCVLHVLGCRLQILVIDALQRSSVLQ